MAQSSSNGAIGYVEYSWALQAGFPVAKLLNAAGYYTLPSPGHVAVSLLQDQVNTDSSDPSTYLTQNLSGVYTNKDPRNYELSAYSYFILPTDLSHGMTDNKGYTIGTFGSYALCLGQSQVDVLGYSALPINLVEDGFAQLQKVPGSAVPTETSAAIAQCHNPTFSTNGTNTLAEHDPQPLPCDKQGATQCAPGVQEPTETGVSSTVTSGGTGGGGSTGGGSTGGGSDRGRLDRRRGRTGGGDRRRFDRHRALPPVPGPPAAGRPVIRTPASAHRPAVPPPGQAAVRPAPAQAAVAAARSATARPVRARRPLTTRSRSRGTTTTAFRWR